MQIPSTFIHEITAESKLDEVGLWYIIVRLREEFVVTDPQRLRQTTLQCVAELLQLNEVVAGYYKPDGTGIDVWSIPPESIVSRIETEWDTLGREPNIGEIVVFIGRAGS